MFTINHNKFMMSLKSMMSLQIMVSLHILKPIFIIVVQCHVSKLITLLMLTDF